MADARFFDNYGPFSLEELARISGATLYREQDKSRIIGDVAALDAAGESDLSFFSNKKYLAAFKESKAGACVVQARFAEQAPKNIALLIADNPYACYAQIAATFYPASLPAKGSISASAIIDASAKLGENTVIQSGVVIGPSVVIGANVTIGAGSVIGRGVEIGEGSVIGASVSISHAVIGRHAIIHGGVRIGQDGFGFAFKDGKHYKVPQLGRVVIGDDVEIGANSCIDRGAGPDTIIGDNCKIDNLVQIGHNVQLGRGCIVVAQVGIAGSTQIGNFAVLGGQVGIAGHLTIGDGAQIAAQSGVMKDVRPGEKLGGSPAVNILKWHRQTIALQQLLKKVDNNE